MAIGESVGMGLLELTTPLNGEQSDFRANVEASGYAARGSLLTGSSKNANSLVLDPSRFSWTFSAASGWTS